jgi:putative hemolysin
MVTVELAIVLLLILLNGLFAMAEMSLVSASKARLQHWLEQGRGAARTALDLKEDPGRFLSTVQIGITAIGILAGTYGGATLGDRLGAWLVVQLPPAAEPYADAISITVVVIAITYLSLILGELVPKRLALAHPERISIRLAGFMRVLSRIAAPAELLLSASTNLVLKLMPTRAQAQATVTEEEINLMLREGAAAGEFHVGETEIVQAALRLGDRRVGAVMTPRTQVDWIDLATPESEQRAKLLDSPYSRFPVCEGGAQNVVGMVQVKDLAAAALAGKPFDLRAVVRKPVFIPDTVTALRALEMFKKSGAPMAFVVDEYGDFEGIVTLNDILQALVGDIAGPGEETDPSVVKRDDGSWLLDGMLGLDQLRDVTGLATLPQEEEADFHTLGGFMMSRINRVPMVGDKFMLEGWRFEVVDMDGRRVDRVLVVPPKPPAS